MKKHKFSFDVSALTNYTDQESTSLLLRAFFENKTYRISKANGADLETGIKSSKAMQKLSVTAVPQAYTTCGFNPSGSATFTQRTLTVGKIAYMDTLCPKTLEAKWTQKLLTSGQNIDESKMTFNETISQLLVALVGEHTEVMDWQGDTASANEYLNKYDGLIKTIDAAAVSIAGNTAAISSITISNAFAAVVAMIDKTPKELKGKPNLVLYVGTDTYDKYTTNLLNLNLFHHVADTAAYESTVPSKGVKIVGVPGLDGTNRMFLMQATNISWGTDMEGEDEDFKIWYSQDDDNIKYAVRFARGVNVAYPNEIVQFTLA
jgi:hypothetical protein